MAQLKPNGHVNIAANVLPAIPVIAVVSAILEYDS